VPVPDLGLNHNPPQTIEATDEVAHRVREKVMTISNPDAANESFLPQESFLERYQASG